MITFDNIISLIERCKTPYIRISDYHGNKIMIIENTNLSTSISELKDVEPMLRPYGKLEVTATNKAGYEANYKGAYKWIMVFDKVIPNNQMNGMMGQNWGFNQFKSPEGYVSNEVMLAKLELIKKEMEWNRKFDELKKLNENKADQYMGYLPFVMSALGKDDATIEKMIKWNVMGKQLNASPGSMAYVPPTNTLTFKDVEKMTPEDKNKKIETLMNSIADKGLVSAEHMILILEALDKRPELAEKAVNFLPML